VIITNKRKQKKTRKQRKGSPQTTGKHIALSYQQTKLSLIQE